MKKIIKKIIVTVLITLLLICLAFMAYRLYSIKILKDVAGNLTKFETETGDYSYKITTTYYKSPITSSIEVKKKGNIYTTITDDYGKKYVEWRDINGNNPYYNYYKYELNSKENIEYSYILHNDICTFFSTDVKYNIGIKTGTQVGYWDYAGLFEKAINAPINTFLYSGEYEGEKCYIYKDQSNFETYISKEAMLPIATKMYEKDGSLHTTTYIEYNTTGITEELLNKPDIQVFDNANYRDTYWNELRAYWVEIPEEFVSIVLEDTLIENVDLKENEELEFFDLKENSSGLKQVRISTYETYEKFRNKYSNLRELTEKDFEYYYVTIAYKKGAKLIHSDTIKSSESFMTNYIFSEEASSKDSIVVIITPKYEELNFNIVISNNKITIPSEKAFEIYRENIEEIKENNNIDKDISVDSGSDKIVKLDNKTYKNLNYIKTELKEDEEPLCWKITDSVLEKDNTLRTIETYINAITGELIGTSYKNK